MIIKKEYTVNRMSFPCLNRNFLSGITAIFLVKTSFSFTDEDDFGSQTTWRQAIIDKDIIPLYDVKNVNDESSDEQYTKSKFNYSYRSADAIKKFTLLYLFDLYFHTRLQEYAGTDYDIIFADTNNNLYATTPDGTTVKGLTTTMIDTRSMKIGSAQPAWSPLTVELYDANEWDVYGKSIKPTWNIKKNDIVFVTFSDVSGTSDSLTFTLKDSVYGVPISGLGAHSFTILDNVNGYLAASNIRELDSGVYTLSGMSDTVYLGYISIDGIYYGSHSYTVTSVYLIPNSGAPGTTDWINTTDGLAEYWEAANTPGLPGEPVRTYSIHTGIGFNGNAQKIHMVSPYFGTWSLIKQIDNVSVSPTFKITMVASFPLALGVKITYSDITSDTQWVTEDGFCEFEFSASTGTVEIIELVAISDDPGNLTQDIIVDELVLIN